MRRSRGVLAATILWLCSLVAAAGIGTAAAQRQVVTGVVPVGPVAPPAPQMVLPESQMVTGENLAFVIERTGRDGAPIGTLMIRVDGKWMRAELSPRWGVRPVR